MYNSSAERTKLILETKNPDMISKDLSLTQNPPTKYSTPNISLNLNSEKGKGSNHGLEKILKEDMKEKQKEGAKRRFK